MTITNSKEFKESVKSFNNTYTSKEHYTELIKETLFENYLTSSHLELAELKKFAFNAYRSKNLLGNTLKKYFTLDDYFLLSDSIARGYYRFHQPDKDFKTKNSLSIIKEFGVFYTPITIAREMASSVVEGSTSKRIIDPCCGTGNLLAACLEYAKKKKVSLQRIVGIELDPLAAKTSEKLLKHYASCLELEVEIHIINMDALDYFKKFSNTSLDELGSIIINPPYGKLKFNSDNLKNKETKLDYKENHQKRKISKTEHNKLKIREIVEGLEVGKGDLGWSKIFLALCLKVLKRNECMSFIGPCSLLNSKSYSELRTQLFNSKKLESIHFISESNTGFDTVNQALSIVNFSSDNSYFQVKNDFGPKSKFSYKNWQKLDLHGYAIPRVSVEELKLFISIQGIPKIRDKKNVLNLRGELDQTMDKSLIRTKPNSLRLIRGENVGRYKDLNVPKERRFFVDSVQFEKKFGSKPKGRHYTMPRIVGRQCSYMKQKSRLVFNYYDSNIVVGNSCNYLIIPPSEAYFYLGVLNSIFMDWYFRVNNGNNHVGNYEINDFPIPRVNAELKKLISNHTKNILLQASSEHYKGPTKRSDYESYLDFLVLKAFDLKKNQIELILKNYDPIYSQLILNHVNNGLPYEMA